MNSIILLEGNVEYNLTLDPSVWIFDDRKVELSKAFLKETNNDEKNDQEAQTISKSWDRELEQTLSPPVHHSCDQFQKEKVVSGSFGMPFKPFLENATPKDDASKLVIETSIGETHVIPLKQAKELVLGFSKDGKPLKEDGPVHVYYGDGSNKENPITHVTKLIVK